MNAEDLKALDHEDPKIRWAKTLKYFQEDPEQGGSAALLQAALYDGAYNNTRVRIKAVQSFKKLNGQWRKIAIQALQGLVLDHHVGEAAKSVLEKML